MRDQESTLEHQLDFVESSLGIAFWRYYPNRDCFVASPMFRQLTGLSENARLDDLTSLVTLVDQIRVPTEFKKASNETSFQLQGGDHLTFRWQSHPADETVLTGVTLPGLVGDKPFGVSESLEESLDSLPAVAYIYNRDLIPIYINAFCRHKVGLTSPLEILQVPLFRPGEDEPCSHDLLPPGDAVRTGQVATLSNIEMVAPDGLRKSFFMWAKPIRRNAEGEVDQVLCLMLMDTRQSMGIQQYQLDTDTVKATKNRFLANISHELRTPLTAIIGYLQLARPEFDTDVSRFKNIDLASENALHLQSLIDDILEVAKIESNDLELNESRYCIREMIAGLDSHFAPLAEIKGLQFSTRVVRDSNKDLHGDREKVFYVLSNLIENAIKFTHRGHVSVLVVAQHGELRIEVADTGVGINENKRRQMFEPFQEQLDYQSKEGQAIGLGLPICRSYVDLMQGTIEIESEVNKGTRFVICAPVPDEQTDDSVEHDSSLLEEDEDEFDDDGWDLLAEEVAEVDLVILRRMKEAVLKADPVSFKTALTDSGLAREFQQQLEFMLNSYQYDDVLSLVELSSGLGTRVQAAS